MLFHDQVFYKYENATKDVNRKLDELYYHLTEIVGLIDRVYNKVV